MFFHWTAVPTVTVIVCGVTPLPSMMRSCVCPLATMPAEEHEDDPRTEEDDACTESVWAWKTIVAGRTEAGRTEAGRTEEVSARTVSREGTEAPTIRSVGKARISSTLSHPRGAGIVASGCVHYVTTDEWLVASCLTRHGCAPRL